MRGLTAKEEAFAQFVADGEPQSAAYRQAYSSRGNSRSVAVEASRLAKRPKVATRIAELRQRSADEHGLSRIEKRIALANLARDDSTPAAVVVNAIQVDNRMTGDDEPIKQSVSGHVVFVCDPIGNGARGQLAVEAITMS